MVLLMKMQSAVRGLPLWVPLLKSLPYELQFSSTERSMSTTSHTGGTFWLSTRLTMSCTVSCPFHWDLVPYVLGHSTAPLPRAAFLNMGVGHFPLDSPHRCRKNPCSFTTVHDQSSSCSPSQRGPHCMPRAIGLH